MIVNQEFFCSRLPTILDYFLHRAGDTAGTRVSQIKQAAKRPLFNREGKFIA
jgi:hypothetical protein